MVTDHQGWQFINEGAAQNKSKWGYVSTEPGSVLKVCVDLLRSCQLPTAPCDLSCCCPWPGAGQHHRAGGCRPL